jgi:hypothetical protein
MGHFGDERELFFEMNRFTQTLSTKKSVPFNWDGSYWMLNTIILLLLQTQLRTRYRCQSQFLP